MPVIDVINPSNLCTSLPSFVQIFKHLSKLPVTSQVLFSMLSFSTIKDDIPAS
jgi:hypothetical protein